MGFNIEKGYKILEEKSNFHTSGSIENTQLLADGEIDSHIHEYQLTKRRKLRYCGYLPAIIVTVYFICNALLLRQVFILNTRIHSCPSEYSKQSPSP